MDLLTRLADIPRWVEARGMLLSGRGQVIGDASARAIAVAAADAGLAVVVKWDAPSELSHVLANVPREFTIVAPEPATEALRAVAPARLCEGATLFTLPMETRERFATADPRVRLLTPADAPLLDTLPPALRGELKRAATFSPIAAAFVQAPEPSMPSMASVAYAGWETESLWDVSIDTLADWRRQGLAKATCSALISHYLGRAKAPVWGAVDSNVASDRLARSLGFEPIDRLVILYPDDAHVHHSPAPYSRTRLSL